MSQSGEEFATQLAYVAQGRAKSRSVRPLRRLAPFLYPYRWQIAAALVGLLLSSAVTLMIPALLRNVIDFGFTPAAIARLKIYFLPLLVAAAAWAGATSFRFYYVTWLGERVIADIRRAVFDHVIGLTPAFFEVTRTGEVLSRLTADTH